MVSILTAEQFARIRRDLPDNGRFSELIEGHPHQFCAPDEDHSRVVMNLTREISTYLHSHPRNCGYACFDLGLIVARNRDTALFPSVSYFEGAQMFAESDKTITEALPRLVVDIVSTQDRRQLLDQRVQHFIEASVEAIWVADPKEATVTVHSNATESRTLQADEILVGESGLLPGFQVAVSNLFAQPTWWQT